MIQDIKENTNEDLLEVIRKKLHCTYISDLRNEPNNTFARQLLKKINLKKYSNKVLNDAYNYLFCSEDDTHFQENIL